MPNPLVSILIRSMDRPTLGRALDSAAAQTWDNLEIVVVAACGTRHRPLPEAHRGRPLRFVMPAMALDRPRAANACLDAAQGEWLNFLDDDDELLPEHVATLLAAPRRDNERVIYSRAVIHDPDGKPTGHCGVAGFHAQLYFQNRSHPAATMFHRSLVDEGVRFDEAFPIFEDRDFMINCATRGPFRFVDAVTCVWHAHIGESGLGHGNNDDSSVEGGLLQRLRDKWQAPFAQWLAQTEAQLFLGQHILREYSAEQALPYLEAALAREPSNVNALNLCGVAHYRCGNLERAEALLSRAVALVPGHRALVENLEMVRRARTAASG